MSNYSFLNPFSYQLVRNNTDLLENEPFSFFIDGEWLCKFFRWFTPLNPKRISFDMTTLAPKVFESCSKEQKSVYFIGSQANEIAEAMGKIKEAYPNLRIAGYRDGYIKGVEKDAYHEILSSGADVVVVGMGTPLQEQFLLKLMKEGFKGHGFTCGGFLHQTAKQLAYYPQWVDRMNLRWAYRIYDEPKLFSRYFIDYPKFVFKFLYDLKYNRWWEGKIIEDYPDEII